MKVATKILLSSKERQQLKKNVRSMTTPIRLAERSKIVILAADGFTNGCASLKLTIKHSL